LHNNLRTLPTKCDFSDVVFICSKADAVDEREVCKSLKLPATSSKTECVVARNNFVNKDMKQEIQRMVADMAFGDEEHDFS
jgi:hypothetical protein